LRFNRVAVVSVLVVVLVLMTPNNWPMVRAQAQSQVSRQVNIPVKVVFVGVDPSTVDTSYITWPGNLPETTYNEVFEPPPGGSLTGVVYNVSYTFTFANSDFKSRLESYLQSIEVASTVGNPWFYYYTATPSGYISTAKYYSLKSSFYDANQVESWIYNNQQELGGFPSNGWTLMFMYLPELPSFDYKDYRDFLGMQRASPPNGTAHYYSVVDQDTDLGYRWKTMGTFMTGWGGVHRFWFDDLSAGPSFWTNPEDMPLQIALKDNHFDLNTSYGKTWFTEYLSDYIWQATWNFVTPFFEYDPLYSNNYSFHVHVFDNRTNVEKAAVDIHSTVDSEEIKRAFQDLVPYSTVDVSLTFEDMTKYPELQGVIDTSYKYTDSFTFGISGQPLQYGIVDARPVYKYLEDNLQTFEPNFHRDRSEFTVPVFAFAFSNDTLFTFTYKWEIARNVESSDKALLGVALGDLAMISVSQHEFQYGSNVAPPEPGKGYGFTETIIHESGHMLGLPHPHNFGPVGDFILSVMGYYTWDYTFGQSDKDMLQRAHVDQIYLETQSILAGISGSQADSAKAQLSDTDSKYSQMDYSGALASVLKAESMAKSATFAGNLAVAPAIYLVVGVVIGFVVAWVLLRRRASLPAHADQTPIRTTATARFCPNCGSATYPNNIYCHECGNKLP
jgi:hypothetical protein